jgi:hypothetical protein
MALIRNLSSPEDHEDRVSARSHWTTRSYLDEEAEEARRFARERELTVQTLQAELDRREQEIAQLT